MPGPGRQTAILGLVVALASALLNWVTPYGYCSTCSWSIINGFWYWSYWNPFSFIVPSVRLLGIPIFLFSWIAMVISALIEIRKDAIKVYPAIFGIVALVATIPVASYYDPYNPLSDLGYGFYLGAVAVVLFFIAYAEATFSSRKGPLQGSQLPPSVRTEVSL